MIEGVIAVILCCYGLIFLKIKPMKGKVKAKAFWFPLAMGAKG
jgi:hypothetical protein